MTYANGNSCPGLGQTEKCGRFKPVNGIPNFPSIIFLLWMICLMYFQGCYVNIDEFKSQINVLSTLTGDRKPVKGVGNQCWLSCSKRWYPIKKKSV